MDNWFEALVNTWSEKEIIDFFEMMEECTVIIEKEYAKERKQQ